MTLLSEPHLKSYQGSKIVNVPDGPGLYAWYYRPASIYSDVTVDILSQFLTNEIEITTRIKQRYGLKIIGLAKGETVIGTEEQDIQKIVKKAFDEAGPFLNWFFKSGEFVQFSRPVYIGIAKNLHERVYNQHYSTLTEYWEDNSQISKFLSANVDATVQLTMDRLDLNHSFALEARVRGISTRDLMVSILETDRIPVDIGSDSTLTDNSTRRSLERLLQLLSDPICGRR